LTFSNAKALLLFSACMAERKPSKSPLLSTASCNASLQYFMTTQQQPCAAANRCNAPTSVSPSATALVAIDRTATLKGHPPQALIKSKVGCWKKRAVHILLLLLLLRLLLLLPPQQQQRRRRRRDSFSLACIDK
jgi:hypothetical protein